jgi:hypothetical protein
MCYLEGNRPVRQQTWEPNKPLGFNQFFGMLISLLCVGHPANLSEVGPSFKFNHLRSTRFEGFIRGNVPKMKLVWVYIPDFHESSLNYRVVSIDADHENAEPHDRSQGGTQFP